MQHSWKKKILVGRCVMAATPAGHPTPNITSVTNKSIIVKTLHS